MKQLEIYHNKTPMGILTQHSKDYYTFEYYPSYLATDFPPLSLTMPKSQSKYESVRLFSFFIALLPEGVNRKTICLHNKIDENDDFSLLDFFVEKDIIGSTYIKRLS